MMPPNETVDKKLGMPKTIVVIKVVEKLDISIIWCKNPKCVAGENFTVETSVLNNFSVINFIKNIFQIYVI